MKEREFKRNKRKIGKKREGLRETKEKRGEERRKNKERERGLKRSNFSNKSFCVISFTWMCVWHNLTKKEDEKIWLMRESKEKRRVCVCVWEKEKEKERERDRGRESLNLRSSRVRVCEQNICLLIWITFIIFSPALLIYWLIFRVKNNVHEKKIFGLLSLISILTVKSVLRNYHFIKRLIHSHKICLQMFDGHIVP